MKLYLPGYEHLTAPTIFTVWVHFCLPNFGQMNQRKDTPLTQQYSGSQHWAIYLYSRSCVQLTVSECHFQGLKQIGFYFSHITRRPEVSSCWLCFSILMIQGRCSLLAFSPWCQDGCCMSNHHVCILGHPHLFWSIRKMYVLSEAP